MKSLSMLIVISFLIGCSNRKEAREAVNFSKIIVIGDLPEAIEGCLADGLTDFPEIRVNVAGAPQIIVHARVVDNANHSFATLTRSILNFDMIADGVKIAFTNVHFSPKTNFAEAHLKETLSLTFKKDKKPIILGDFNLFSLEHFKKSYSDYYTASSEKYFYVSYPEQNTTLDYILLPKEYRFIGVSCPDVFVSDHRALFATVIIK